MNDIEPQIVAKLLKLPSDQLGKTLALMWGFGCRECALSEPLMTGRGDERRELRPHICFQYNEDSRKCTVFPTLIDRKNLSEKVSIDIEQEHIKLLRLVDSQLSISLAKETMLYGCGGKNSFLWAGMKQKVLEGIAKFHIDEKMNNYNAQINMLEVITLSDIRDEITKRKQIKIVQSITAETDKV